MNAEAQVTVSAMRRPFFTAAKLCSLVKLNSGVACPIEAAHQRAQYRRPQLRPLRGGSRQICNFVYVAAVTSFSASEPRTGFETRMKLTSSRDVAACARARRITELATMCRRRARRAHVRAVHVVAGRGTERELAEEHLGSDHILTTRD